MGGEGEAQGAAAATAMPRRVPAAREKSSFAVTCSLLSQYLKENKGGLHGLGMAPPPPAGAGVVRPPVTMNLLSALDAPAEKPKDAANAPPEPRASGAVDLSLEEEASTESPELVAPTDGEIPREDAGEAARQLTIFYGGKVVVFDGFPATKVKDLLQIVNGGLGVDNKAISNAAPQNLPTPSHNLSDIPIARRNSLHRFLEKRKGRIAAKAPYKIDTSVEASNKQATGEKSWLGLSQEVAVKQDI